jgi:tetratricopeptide (TPR) repeat protein
VLQFSPDDPDVSYLVGEIYRLREEYDAAQEAYERALEVDENFAPTYLGLARLKLAQNPKAKVEEELSTAIEKDSTAKRLSNAPCTGLGKKISKRHWKTCKAPKNCSQNPR